MVDPADPVVLVGEPRRFVGRGGEKLAAALESFDLDATGLRVLDAGASTGGFTDCLLQSGASEVVALDVGHGQLHEQLRADGRVVVIERTNLRDTGPAELGRFDAAVADLSFISLTLVLEVLFELVRPRGWLVVLVKPQFETSRAEASRGRGVISDPVVWSNALTRVLDAATELGAAIMDVMVSPLRGTAGNVEFLVHMAAPGGRPPNACRSEVVGAHHVGPSRTAGLVASAVADATLRETDRSGIDRTEEEP